MQTDQHLIPVNTENRRILAYLKYKHNLVSYDKALAIITDYYIKNKDTANDEIAEIKKEHSHSEKDSKYLVKLKPATKKLIEDIKTKNSMESLDDVILTLVERSKQLKELEEQYKEEVVETK